MDLRSRRCEGWGTDLRLIDVLKGKMISKWVALNIVISIMIIVIVGYSIKEFACYQFNQFSLAQEQSKQFRQEIETYLLYASIFAFILAVGVHLFFAQKILRPLRIITRSNTNLHRIVSDDEVGQIAKDILLISNRVNELQKQHEKMMADIAHELRTPLTTLYGYLQGIEDGIFTFGENTTLILKKECERLITFIERMNELHEWEHKEMHISEVNVKRLLEMLINENQHNLEKEGLYVQMALEQVQLHSDAEALRAVMQELLNNVFSYHSGEKVILQGYRRGGDYFISISNEGTPISNEDAKYLFDRFYRVETSRNRSSGGAGLGLAIAKQIVSRLGGQIGYHFDQQYHTFWFSIPLRKVAGGTQTNEEVD